MSGGYDEQTYVRPNDGAEVYGQAGFGFYTYADTARDLAERSKARGKPLALRPSRNPLFTYLDGVTSARLRGWGFVL